LLLVALFVAYSVNQALLNVSRAIQSTSHTTIN
jgi:hypothetical protein